MKKPVRYDGSRRWKSESKLSTRFYAIRLLMMIDSSGFNSKYCFTSSNFLSRDPHLPSFRNRSQFLLLTHHNPQILLGMTDFSCPTYHSNRVPQ